MGNQSSCGLVPEYILPSWKEYSLGLKGGFIPTCEDIKSQTNIYQSLHRICSFLLQIQVSFVNVGLVDFYLYL